jgi:hypothetical protein
MWEDEKKQDRQLSGVSSRLTAELCDYYTFPDVQHTEPGIIGH